MKSRVKGGKLPAHGGFKKDGVQHYKDVTFQFAPQIFYKYVVFTKDKVATYKTFMPGVGSMIDYSSDWTKAPIDWCMPGTTPNDEWTGEGGHTKRVYFGSAKTAVKNYDDCVVVEENYEEQGKRLISKAYYARNVGWVLSQEYFDGEPENNEYTSQLDN